LTRIVPLATVEGRLELHQGGSGHPSRDCRAKYDVFIEARCVTHVLGLLSGAGEVTVLGRLALPGVLLVAVALRLWRLDQNGFGNEYRASRGKKGPGAGANGAKSDFGSYDHLLWRRPPSSSDVPPSS
jgi:hypothetical protein